MSIHKKRKEMDNELSNSPIDIGDLLSEQPDYNAALEEAGLLLELTEEEIQEYIDFYANLGRDTRNYNNDENEKKKD